MSVALRRPSVSDEALVQCLACQICSTGTVIEIVLAQLFEKRFFSLNLNRIIGFQFYMTCNRKNFRCLFCVFDFQKFYSQTLVFQIVQGAQKLTLLVQGQGLEPRLEFSPSVLELGPLLPYAPGDEAEVVVKNPCDFPIEFYSLEFDQQYLLDEKVSRGQN